MSRAGVEICLVKYHSPEMETQCIGRILSSTSWPFLLTVHDNREEDEKCTAKIWNRFIRLRRRRYLLILDSDALVGKGWLTGLMQIMLDYPETAGVVVPRTDRTDEQHQTKYNKLDPPSVILRPSGFCFLLDTDILKDTGGFCEEFGFYGQDSEFFMRMHYRTHWKAYINPAVFVHHVNHYSVATVNDPYDFQADKERALKLYHAKTRGWPQRV